MSSGWNIRGILSSVYGKEHGVEDTGTDNNEKASVGAIAPVKTVNPAPIKPQKPVRPQVNASDAMVPQNQSMQPLYEKAINIMGSYHANEEPDSTYKPFLKEAGRQYQRFPEYMGYEA